MKHGLVCFSTEQDDGNDVDDEADDREEEHDAGVDGYELHEDRLVSSRSSRSSAPEMVAMGTGSFGGERERGEASAL
jgi:hypothetical protein